MDNALHLTVQSVITELDDNGVPVPDGSNSYRTECDGVFSATADGYRLRYRETTENGLVNTILTFPADRAGICMTSTGARNCRMRLFPDVEDTSEYEIPPFRFPMSVTLTAIQNTMTEDGGDIRLSYRLTIGGQPERVSMLIRAVREEKTE